MLIKRVFEADPLACPLCGGEMKVVDFIEPPQGDVIEKILRHCGLWLVSTPRPPPDAQDLVYEPDGVWDDSSANQDSHSPDRQTGELIFVDEATFWATF